MDKDAPMMLTNFSPKLLLQVFSMRSSMFYVDRRMISRVEDFIPRIIWE